MTRQCIAYLRGSLLPPLTRLSLAFLPLLFLSLPMADAAEHPTLRVATFNASMEGGNYVARGDTPTGGELAAALAYVAEHQEIWLRAEVSEGALQVSWFDVP